MSPAIPFALVTGNRNKLLEARRIVGPDLEAVEIDLPELQSLDIAEVLAAKAEEAWQRLRRPLVVEDTGLALAALNGFPGPLVKWLLQSVGPAGITRLAESLGDPRATALCRIVYRDAERCVTAEGRAEGTLVPPRGTTGFGWDAIFQPAGETRTYSELDPAHKDAIGHRGLAWQALLGKLGSEGV